MFISYNPDSGQYPDTLIRGGNGIKYILFKDRLKNGFNIGLKQFLNGTNRAILNK